MHALTSERVRVETFVQGLYNAAILGENRCVFNCGWCSIFEHVRDAEICCYLAACSHLQRVGIRVLFVLYILVGRWEVILY